MRGQNKNKHRQWWLVPVQAHMSKTGCKTITGQRTGSRKSSSCSEENPNREIKWTTSQITQLHLCTSKKKSLKTIGCFTAPVGLRGLKEPCWLVGLTLWPPLLDLSRVSWTAHETASKWLNTPWFTSGAEDDQRPPEHDGARNVCTRSRRVSANVLTQWIQALGFVWLLLFCCCAVVANLCLGHSWFDESLAVCLWWDIVSHTGQGWIWLFFYGIRTLVCVSESDSPLSGLHHLVRVT